MYVLQWVFGIYVQIQFFVEMLMLVLSYRRRNGVPENKRAQLCRGRSEFYLTLAPVFFHFTLYFVFYNLLAVGASRTFTWNSALPTIASQCWAGPLWRLATWVWRDIHPLWTMWTKKHIQILLPSHFLLPLQTASARYSCNMCSLQRVTQLQSTEQPQHAVFTYSWLWPRIHFFSFISLRL